MLKKTDDADGNYHRTEERLVIENASGRSADDNQEDNSLVLIVSNGNDLLTAFSGWLAKLKQLVSSANIFDSFCVELEGIKFLLCIR